MVATNEILLPECTGEECAGDNDICTDSRVQHRNAENRAPVARKHRSAPIPSSWLTRDPIGYQGGINLYGYVDSSPVGMVDAWGTVPWLTFSEGGWTYTSSGNPATATVTPANVPNPAAASAGPPPPFGLSADRWENPGAHFVGGMGKFTAQIGWMSAYSSGVVVTFFPGNRLKNKKCGCKLIGFVQYEKDATAFSSHGSVALPSGWSVDGGFPYPHQTEWSPGGKHYAELRDAPGLRYLGPYLYNQWVFEARDVAVCLSGHDKGDSFGAVYWGFYFNWGAGRVTRWVGGQGVKTGPVTSQNVSVDILRPFAPLP